MNLRRLSARTAAVGVSTVLAAGALVGAGTTTANAAVVSNTYTCTIDLLSQSFDTTLTATGGVPVTTAAAGMPIAANLIALDVTATIPAEFAPTLAQFGVTSAESDDFTLALGKGSIPIPLTGSIVTEGGATSWKATGKNKAFTLPGAGKVSATMPKKFNFIANTTVAGPVPIPCALKAGQTTASLGDVTLSKQTTKTTAKAAKGKVNVTVKGSASPATSGQVVVLDGKKVVGKANVNKLGKAVVKLKKLSKGTHKLVASFKGNASFKASKSKKITVTVK